METQERIRIIELAWEWVGKIGMAIIPDHDKMLEEIAKYFDQAYKDIVKTVTSK